MKTKRILFTPGEPAGIGPELAVKIAHTKHDFELVAVCDPSLLQDTAKHLSLPITLREFDIEKPRLSDPGAISIIPTQLQSKTKPGVLEPANAQYVLKTLKTAADLCLSRKADALVTGPVHKGVINDAGIAFSGHTEFFAQAAGVHKVVMMLATQSLRVALATTHLPLKDVSNAITRESLSEVIQILIEELKSKFGIKNSPHFNLWIKSPCRRKRSSRYRRNRHNHTCY